MCVPVTLNATGRSADSTYTVAASTCVVARAHNCLHNLHCGLRSVLTVRVLRENPCCVASIVRLFDAAAATRMYKVM